MLKLVEMPGDTELSVTDSGSSFRQESEPTKLAEYLDNVNTPEQGISNELQQIHQAARPQSTPHDAGTKHSEADRFP